MKNYLNFETDIKQLEAELENLKDPYNKEGLSEVDTDKITQLQIELDDKLKDIYSNLNPCCFHYCPQFFLLNHF